jgi:hypothetical protein
MTPSGIDSATLRFIAQCLNQLRPREKLGYIRAKFLQSRSSVQKPRNSGLHFSLWPCPQEDTVLRPCKPSQITIPSINQSINPTFGTTNTSVSVSLWGFTGSRHKRATFTPRCLSVTRETAFYGSGRTSGLNRCDNSSSDSRGCRFLIKGGALERQYPHNGPVIQGDHKLSVHLMITIQKVTSNVRSRMFSFGLFSSLVYEDGTDRVFRNIGY